MLSEFNFVEHLLELSNSFKDSWIRIDCQEIQSYESKNVVIRCILTSNDTELKTTTSLRIKHQTFATPDTKKQKKVIGNYKYLQQKSVY